MVLATVVGPLADAVPKARLMLAMNALKVAGVGALLMGEVFPNAACTVSLIDRLVHRCEVVAIEGESYRLKEAQARAELKAAQRRTAQPKTGKS